MDFFPRPTDNPVRLNFDSGLHLRIDPPSRVSIDPTRDSGRSIGSCKENIVLNYSQKIREQRNCGKTRDRSVSVQLNSIRTRRTGKLVCLVVSKREIIISILVECPCNCLFFNCWTVLIRKNI